MKGLLDLGVDFYVFQRSLAVRSRDEEIEKII